MTNLPGQGTRVKLVSWHVDPASGIDDNQAVPAGTQGTVTAVDGLGTIHVRWDNGPHLGLIPGADQWVTADIQPGPIPTVSVDPAEIEAEIEDWWAAGEPDRRADRLLYGDVDSTIVEADPQVWMSIERRGIDYHVTTGDQPAPTWCGRSTRTGVVLLRSDAAARVGAKPCKRCYPDGV